MVCWQNHWTYSVYWLLWHTYSHRRQFRPTPSYQCDITRCRVGKRCAQLALAPLPLTHHLPRATVCVCGSHWQSAIQWPFPFPSPLATSVTAWDVVWFTDLVLANEIENKAFRGNLRKKFSSDEFKEGPSLPRLPPFSRFLPLDGIPYVVLQAEAAILWLRGEAGRILDMSTQHLDFVEPLN